MTARALFVLISTEVLLGIVLLADPDRKEDRDDPCLNLWMERFRNGKWGALPASKGADDMRFGVDAAIGSRHPEARPSFPEYERLIREQVRPAEYQVVPVVQAPEASGGCG